MKAKDVPQEDSILAGHQRACYAVDEHGRYIVVPSRGWEVEKIVNTVARADIAAAITEARERVRRGEASPLLYHMRRRQMTVALLAANIGFARLRVRWHLRPAAFARLKPAVLARYADVLRISVEELRRLPDEDDRGSSES